MRFCDRRVARCWKVVAGIENIGDANMKQFGSAVFIMTHREELEVQQANICEKMEQIEGLTSSLATLHSNLESFFLHKIVGATDLRKIGGASNLGENLFACANLIKVMSGKLNAIRKLQAEVRAAQALAVDALPSYAAWFSDGRQDVVPGRTYFSADKGAGPTPFATPVQKQAIPMASTASAALSHRIVTKGD